MYAQSYSIQQLLPTGRNGTPRWETKVSRFVHGYSATETATNIRGQAAAWMRYYRFMLDVHNCPRWRRFRLVASVPTWSDAIVGYARNDSPILTPKVKEVLIAQA